MRQADSTIKGYLYQFNKSIYELLCLSDEKTLILEGVIEDIDILSPSCTTTIQCKYHEDKKFLISRVAVPIIEMLCNFIETSYIGKDIKYVLYAYFDDNIEDIDKSDFINFIETTQDKDILVKYFHRIFVVPDPMIINIANKGRKSSNDKNTIINYYKENRSSLLLRIDINDFWNCFKYEKANKYEELYHLIINKFEEITDTAKSLYYPNALSFVSSRSAKKDVNERTVSRKLLLTFFRTTENSVT